MERAVFELDEPVLIPEVDVRGQCPQCQRADHLGDPGDPCGAFQMSDIGFDRADSAALGPCDGALSRVQVPEGFLQSHDLDRIADGCSGAVRFDVGNGFRPDSGAGVEPLDQIRLCRRVGDGEGIGAAAMVRGDTLDDRVDGIAVRDRPRERLQEEHRPAFTADVAVGALVEGARPTGAGQHARLAERDEVLRRPDQIDSAGQGDTALAVAQRAYRFVHRYQRARTCRVVGDARALEVEIVGDPVRDDRVGRPGGEIDVRPCPFAFHHFRVVRMADPHEDARLRTGEGTRRTACVLDGPPGEFESHALLGIHALGLARRNVEELGIEAVRMLDEAAPDAVRLLGPEPGVTEVPFLRPAFRRDFRDERPARDEVAAEFLQGFRAGESQSESDDRDIVRRGRRFERTHQIPPAEGMPRPAGVEPREFR
ncbi:hypothetical protein EES42_18635 [Streptomyces sp. ADI95-17]|nr:hypothetical protein EES42_18635 [Streptomyces sp. ADI95-17]